MNSRRRFAKVRLHPTTALAATLALVASTLVAGAPGRTKLLISSGGSAPPQTTVTAMVAAGAKAIEAYDPFQLIDVPANAVPDFLALATHLGLTVEIRDDFDEVRLPRLMIDTRRPPTIPSYPPGTNGIFVVQFKGPQKAEWSRSLSAHGIIVLQGIQANAALVVATTTALDRYLAETSVVQWVSPYPPEAKGALFGRDDPPADLQIEVANVPGKEQVAERAAAASGFAARTEYGPNDFRIHARLSGADAIQLLAEPLVLGIFHEPQWRLSDERQVLSATMKTGWTSPSPGYQSWLVSNCAVCSNLGPTFKVSIADTGLDKGNVPQGQEGVEQADLRGREVFGSQWATDDCSSPGGYVGCDRLGHGTMVAGIVGGNGATATVDTGNYLLGVGVAPTATIVSTKIENGAGVVGSGTIRSWAPDATNRGAYIQNHSHNDYGHDVSGRYTLESRDFDYVVRDADGDWTDHDDTQITLTVSAGNIDQAGDDPNKQLVSPPATAKNVISVGATENYRPDKDAMDCASTQADSYRNLAIISKRGVLDAAIFKPDLVAPATMIISAKPGTQAAAPWCDNWPYGSLKHNMGSGTSFAAPIAAGVALLAGRIYSSSPSAPAPALRKAMLIAAARSMIGGIDRYTNTSIGARPNSTIGFGLVTLEAIAKSIGSQYVNQSVRFYTSGASWSQDYYTVDQNSLVTIVLAWTDAPGPAGGSPQLVNNLDLTVEVFQPGGCVYRMVGNDISATTENSYGHSCVGSLAMDTKNNVEIVRFTPGLSNQYRVTVRATSLNGEALPLQGISQDFALYAINARLTP